MNDMIETFLAIIRAALRRETPVLQPEPTEEQWKTLIDMAGMHNVLPLFYEAVYSLPSLANSPALLAMMKRRVWQRVAMQAQCTGEFLKLNDQLLDAGIRPLVVKGIICRDLYPQPDHRPSSDEDVLIPPEAFAQCHRILTDRGMQTSQENPSEAYEVPYRDPNSQLYIELHKYLFPPQSEAYGDLNRFFETVRERAVSVQIQGHTVYTLDPTSHLFYLICHAFKHFLHSGFGIRQVCDIVLYANAYGEAVDWEQILQQCREIHGDKFAAALFAIGRKYLVFDPVRACWPQSWQDILVDERPMLEDLLAGGLYGGASMSRKHSSSITLEAVTARKQGKKRGNALLHSAFPSAEKLQQRYPYLQKHRFLLPLAWCSRLWTYRKETRNTADNNAADALKIGAERVELMKLYGIVE